MTIAVIDSLSAMNRVLTADATDRADLIRDMWAPMAGMYHFIPGGVDLATVHQQNFGFPTDSALEQVRDGLQTLAAADAWTRIEKALGEGVAALTAADPGVRVPDLNVLLVLGDPTSTHFLEDVQGLSAFGGISGYITITEIGRASCRERVEIREVARA